MIGVSVKNNKGFTLVEILISVGIMAIVSLAISQLFISQMKQNKQINQKLEATDLNNLLLQVFQTQSLCDLNFKNKKIDISNPNSIPDINIAQISSGLGQYIAKQNTPLSSSQNELFVDKINLTNLKQAGGQYYQGTLKIDLKVGSGYMSPKPIFINQLFDTTSSGLAEVNIDSCVTPGKVVTVVINNNNGGGNGGGGGGGGGNGGGPSAPSAQLTSNNNCAANQGCWLPTSFTGSPGMDVRATASCHDGSGANIGGTNNDLIGTINSQGSFQYTGMWDCGIAPKSGCTQSWTVGGTNVGSHSWQCQ